MSLLLYSAFLVGALGSFHCIGMCGPIALTLPVKSPEFWKLLKGRLLYNLGRVITYSFLGVIVGLLGRGLVLTGSQQWLSILVGVLILLLWFMPRKWSQGLDALKPIRQFTSWIKQNFTFLFKKGNSFSLLLIGVLNGFLPCGLVYLAMAGALATASIQEGALYMAFFGIGTIPMMLVLSMVGKFIKPNFRTWIHTKLLPVFTVTLALLFILRGLNLGIPYVSPKITKTAQAGVHIECCHKP